MSVTYTFPSSSTAGVDLISPSHFTFHITLPGFSMDIKAFFFTVIPSDSTSGIAPTIFGLFDTSITIIPLSPNPRYTSLPENSISLTFPIIVMFFIISGFAGSDISRKYVCPLSSETTAYLSLTFTFLRPSDMKMYERILGLLTLDMSVMKKRPSSPTAASIPLSMSKLVRSLSTSILQIHFIVEGSTA